jgi:hypothetical protein
MKNKHGGNRPGAGPKFKDEGEHKIQVQVGIEKDKIKESVGLKKLQHDIKEWFYKKLSEINS